MELSVPPLVAVFAILLFESSAALTPHFPPPMQPRVFHPVGIDDPSPTLLHSTADEMSHHELSHDQPSSSFSSRRRAALGFIPSIVATAVGVASIVPSSASAVTRDPRSGVLLPSEGEISSAIPTNWDDDDDPFRSSSSIDQFTRLDSTSDSIFYSTPRFVEHVDANAVETMTSYISNVVLKEDGGKNRDVLDLCSSWTSHIDPSKAASLHRVAGLGMNVEELKSNGALTEWTVQDLNVKPTLPYDGSSFDVVLCQLSVDYLTKPLDVMKEVGRVLKPGGAVVILFSNRLFLSKAVGLWTGADDIDHAYTVGAYLHYCQRGLFDNIKAGDLSMRKGRGNDRPIVGDPLYVVTARKAVSSLA